MEDYTFLMDRNVDKLFDEWRSALLDILIDHCSPDGDLGTIPASTLGDWLNEQVEITGNQQDVLLISDPQGALSPAARHRQTRPGPVSHSARYFDKDHFTSSVQGFLYAPLARGK